MDFKPLPGPDKPFVHDAAGEIPAPQDEAPRDAMQDHIPLVHAEIQERLRAVLIPHKDRRLLGLGGEGQSRVHAVIGGGDGLNAGLPQNQ